MAEEMWKDIPGYEGKYQVSDMGRVKSLKRKVRSRNRYTGRDFCRTVSERILRPGRFCKSGHVSVVLEHGGVGKPVHQLVMLAFIGPTPDGMEIRHLNGNPADNRLVNLKFGTRTENILDVYYQGKRWRKLSIEDVVYIRFACFCGFPDQMIADEFSVTPGTVAEIRKGNSYQWLD